VTLQEQLDDVLLELALQKFHVAVSACDGAGENRSLLRSMCTESAFEYFTPEEQERWTEMGVDLSFKVAALSFVNDLPNFMLSDMPHLIKKVANALEMAMKTQRNPKREAHHRNLQIPAKLGSNNTSTTSNTTNNLGTDSSSGGTTTSGCSSGSSSGNIGAGSSSGGSTTSGSTATSGGSSNHSGIADTGTPAATTTTTSGGSAAPAAPSGVGGGAPTEDRWLPVHLGMLEDAWVCHEKPSGGGKFGLQINRTLTNEHFQKNSFSRMRVYLAMQVLSSKMVAIIDATQGILDPKKTGTFSGIRELCRRLNRLVDILNSTTEKAGIEFIDRHDHPLLEELMDTLAWFWQWKHAVTAHPTWTAKEKKAAFLPDECWADLQSLVLGFVCACKFYLKKYPRAILIARRCSQDIVEHHFAHVRQSNKCKSAIKYSQCFSSTGAAAARRVSGSGKGSHDKAPATIGAGFVLMHK